MQADKTGYLVLMNCLLSKLIGSNNWIPSLEHTITNSNFGEKLKLVINSENTCFSPYNYSSFYLLISYLYKNPLSPEMNIILSYK